MTETAIDHDFINNFEIAKNSDVDNLITALKPYLEGRKLIANHTREATEDIKRLFLLYNKNIKSLLGL